MGSSPTTGAAASKNNPVAQQLRNPAQMVTSAAERSSQQVKVSNNFSTCGDLFLQRKFSLAFSVWEYCLPYCYMSGLVLLQICWGFSVGDLGNCYYFLSMDTLCWDLHVLRPVCTNFKKDNWCHSSRTDVQSRWEKNNRSAKPDIMVYCHLMGRMHCFSMSREMTADGSLLTE